MLWALWFDTGRRRTLARLTTNGWTGHCRRGLGAVGCVVRLGPPKDFGPAHHERVLPHGRLGTGPFDQIRTGPSAGSGLALHGQGSGAFCGTRVMGVLAAFRDLALGYPQGAPLQWTG